MAITNTFTVTIQELDANGQTLARRVASTSDTAATVGEFISGNLATTAESTITLPVAQVRQIWVRNTDSTATITVKWTPTTSSEVTVAVLSPNDQLALWHTTTGATLGASTLKLTASATNTTYEVFIGG